MTNEDKELLLRDLCGRLPYGVKINNEIQGNFVIYGVCENCIFAGTLTEYGWANHIDFHIENIKPYLFPLSSMTEEQKEIYCNLQDKVIYNSKGVTSEDLSALTKWLDENMFDWRGLIPKGLAIDATSKNIY